MADRRRLAVEQGARRSEGGLAPQVGGAGGHLIRDRFGVTCHLRYLCQWLAKRDHSPQKPVRWAP